MSESGSESDKVPGATGPLRLHDKNYSEWTMRTEAALVRKDLWTMIEPVVDIEGKTPEEIQDAFEKALKKRSASKMAQARAMLIERADKSQLVHMQDKDPHIIWQAVKATHKAQGLATRLSLRRTFLSAKKRESEPMSGWISRVKSIRWDLEQIGVRIDNEDLILALTMGLDSSYESFVISLDGTPPEVMTLDFIIARLINEEARRSTYGDNRKSNYDATTEVALTTKSTGNHSRFRSAGGSPRKPDFACWRCGETGHTRDFCKAIPPNKDNNNNNNNNNSNNPSAQEMASLAFQAPSPTSASLAEVKFAL